MNYSSRYWKIWQINPAADKIGYKQITLTTAKEFAEQQVAEGYISNFQNQLLVNFHANRFGEETINCARSGLCLRCYVSEPILKACKKIDSLLSGEKQFTYRDLLPFVLNDDGKKLIIFDRDGKTPLMVDDNLQFTPCKYTFFSITVLQTFNINLQARMSLDNWTYLQTKQNPDLKNFLAEFGFNYLSDWALLNRVRKKQLESFSAEDCHIIEAFHAVYRRDRQIQQRKGHKRCPDPDNDQLQEMLVYLQQYQVAIETPKQLIRQLKQIALQLRQFDIWSSRESLDIYDAESGTYVPRRDLSSESLDEVELEQQEFLQFLENHLQATLVTTIEQIIAANIQKLEKSKKYAPFAAKYIPGLQLYYFQAMSLKEISQELGMSSWDQARRILNPGELLSKVRAKTVEQMLEVIIHKAAQKGLTTIPPQPDYLKTLSEQIESYADREIFQQAAEELRAGKNRTMTSPYAEKIRVYLQSLASPEK